MPETNGKILTRY